MARLFNGTINGWPCVKVTRDSADAPWDVPNAQTAKFLFNSDHQYGYVEDIRTLGGYPWPRPGPGTGYDMRFYDMSGNPWSSGNPWRIVAEYLDGFHAEYLPQYDGYDFPPIVESRERTTPDAPYVGPQYGYSDDVPGYMGSFWSGAPYTVTIDPGEMYTDAGYSGLQWVARSGWWRTPARTERSLMTRWDLPADETPLPQNGTVVPGQMMARFTNLHAQVAKPGYDVRTAPRRQFILNSDRVPAKLIKSGQTSLPGNTTVTVAIDTPFAISAETYIDFHIARAESGARMTQPPMPVLTNYSPLAGFTYRIDPATKQLVLTNPHNVGLVVRWMMLADDQFGQTSGGSRVVYTAQEAGVGYVQVKVPGSSDTATRLKDILLDTRLPTLRIVKEGYIPWAEFTETPDSSVLGEKRKTITFDNPDGFRPFVKFVQKIRVNSASGVRYRYASPGHTVFTLNMSWMQPSEWVSRTNCFSGLADIYDDKVQFHLSANNPSHLVWADGNPLPRANPVFAGTAVPVGLRYYIFALPE